MKIRNLFTLMLVILFSAGMSSTTSAQEWRWREKYYNEHHRADDGWYKDHGYYYRPWLGGIFNWGWGAGWRDYYYDHYTSDDSSYHEYLDKYYNDFYRDYKEHHPFYYRYYDDDKYTEHYRNYRDRFYDDYYHRYRDNYRPEVDNNK
jgi:hypothetical protein